MRYCLLGIHPANQNYSIVKYFNFYKRHLSGALGGEVGAFAPGPASGAADGIIPEQSRIRTRVENYAIWPLRLATLRSDSFHIVDQGLMWYSRFLPRARMLGTVHDLTAYMAVAGKLPFAQAQPGQKYLVGENTRWLLQLDRIVSVSHFTADNLVRELNIPASRITVVPNHVDSRFHPVGDPARYRKKWFGDAVHAIIHVGKPLVYKNRLGAIKAFALLRQRLPAARLFLVNGPCTPAEQAFIQAASCSSAVVFIPPVTIDDLREIYGSADALIFPSYYEGFGWPPLEAMACGCPVVSSRRASLREVVGDAALTVEDPDDHTSLAALLARVLREPSVSAELTERGLDRARLFSEEKALNAMVEVYRDLF